MTRLTTTLFLTCLVFALSVAALIAGDGLLNAPEAQAAQSPAVLPQAVDAEAAGGQVLPDALPGAPAAQLPGAAPEAFPGQDAYKASLKKAEEQYVKQVMEARKAHVQEIKNFMMVASMTPAAAQRLDDEIKRIEALPRPTVDPEHERKVHREVSISMQVPTPLWSIHFSQAKVVDGEIWVLWQLHHRKLGGGIMMIGTTEDKVTLKDVALPADANVRHFVMGKTWNWDDENVEAKYVKDEEEMGKKWAKGRVLDLLRATLEVK